jgi:sigma-B regulation protein RsbU (phosphoserine phosphatase)
MDTVDLGFPLGFVEDITEYVSEIEINLNQDDVVVLYTDGITEAQNAEREQYGLGRLCEVVKRSWQYSASDIRQMIIDDVKQYIGKQVMIDDISLLVMKQV